MNNQACKFSRLESPFIIDALGLIFLFVFWGVAPPLSNDPGVGWHLKTGQWILENWQVPHSDPFLWSTAGKEWISNQWLADIIFWLIFKMGGWDALALFCFSLPLITMLTFQGRILLYESQPKQTSKTEGVEVEQEGLGNVFFRLLAKLVPFLTLALGLFIAWIQWIVRPVIFSFVLFSILFYLIWLSLKYPERITNRSFVFRCVMLFILWANLHSAFPLGLLLLACVGLASFVSKDLNKAKLFIGTALCAALSTLINPYGYKLHLNIMALLGNTYFMKLNSEWLSPSFGDSLFFPIVIAFAILLFRSGVARNNPLWIRLVTACFAILSFKSIRYTPFFGLITPALLSVKEAKGNDLLNNNANRNFYPYTSIAISGLTFIYFLFTDLPKTPKFTPEIFAEQEMWKKVEEECLSDVGRIYNYPDLGGSITYLLNPHCRAGIDDRNELNGEQTYKRFFKISNAEELSLTGEIPSLLLLECKSPLATLSRNGFSNYKLLGEFKRYCLLKNNSQKISQKKQ